MTPPLPARTGHTGPPSALCDGLRCLCGGHVHDRAALVQMSREDAPEFVEWEDYWASIMGPFDLYCVEDDEVLTEKEVLRVRGLHVPTHDDALHGEWFW